ncbi:aldolase/citrate lyase family protein [Aquabacter sp. CN5-332]|uniref:HpcH/HpaI aldolase family protein n=1 Tax=Aquabacter sp. CN5-332 TaxID=3156608 RepID=UPI0032B54482
MNRRAKNAIEAGKPVIAVNPGGFALPVVDALAACGTDCLFIDCERTAISVESVPMLARAAQAHGMSAIVRSYSKDAATLTRYFDCDIDGLVLPQVEAPEEVARLRAIARAATKGREGTLLLIAQIESVEGHRRLDEIAGAPGIDLILVGPNDLAHSMGYLGDTARPEVVAAMDDITARLHAKNIAYGLPVTAETAGGWVKKGARFLYTSLESLLNPSLKALRTAATS